MPSAPETNLSQVSRVRKATVCRLRRARSAGHACSMEPPPCFWMPGKPCSRGGCIMAPRPSCSGLPRPCNMPLRTSFGACRSGCLYGAQRQAKLRGL